MLVLKPLNSKQRLMKNILFPHYFQLLGWVMFIPALIVGILIYSGVLSTTGIPQIILNDITIIGIVLGGLFIVCSKERVEDEMTKSIRLSSLLNSLYINVVILITCTLTMHGTQFMRFAVLNMILLPILFVVNFRLEIQRYNKMCENEE